MSNSSSGTGSNGSRMEVPQAKEAMDRFKMEVANEIGVNLKQGYNGDLTSAQTGSIGGEMVRRMIKRQEEQMVDQIVHFQWNLKSLQGWCRISTTLRKQ